MWFDCAISRKHNFATAIFKNFDKSIIYEMNGLAYLFWEPFFLQTVNLKPKGKNQGHSIWDILLFFCNRRVYMFVVIFWIYENPLQYVCMKEGQGIPHPVNKVEIESSFVIRGIAQKMFLLRITQENLLPKF